MQLLPIRVEKARRWTQNLRFLGKQASILLLAVEKNGYSSD